MVGRQLRKEPLGLEQPKIRLFYMGKLEIHFNCFSMRDRLAFGRVVFWALIS